MFINRRRNVYQEEGKLEYFFPVSKQNSHLFPVVGHSTSFTSSFPCDIETGIRNASQEISSTYAR